MPSGMERWTWKLYQDGMFLHTHVFCWGVLGIHPRATRMVGIPKVMMMNQKAIVPWTSI